LLLVHPLAAALRRGGHALACSLEHPSHTKTTGCRRQKSAGLGAYLLVAHPLKIAEVRIQRLSHEARSSQRASVGKGTGALPEVVQRALQI
jgi:hypothetical protein